MLANYLFMMLSGHDTDTSLKAHFIGSMSDRDVEFNVVDTKTKKIIDDFGTWSTNGNIDVSFPIIRKSVYRVRISSYGMLTHAFLIEMTPGRSVNMGNVNAFLGDVNGDNLIDQRDIYLIKKYKGVKKGSKRWYFPYDEDDCSGRDCDFNNDDVVDYKDLRVAYDNLGKRGSRK